jgi:CRP-like cAMP-binding protein
MSAQLDVVTTFLPSDLRLAMLSLGARQRTVVPGVDLAREGEPLDNMCVLIEGWAARYRTFVDGRRQIVALLLPGDVCCHDVIAEVPQQYSVCALTRARIECLPVRVMRDRFWQDRDLARLFLTEAMTDMSIQQEWTVNLGRRSAAERLGHLFCEIFFRMQRAGLVTDQSCDFPLTQTDLADIMGLTPVHINRTLQQLRSRNLVQLNRRQLIIPDVERLQQESLFRPNYLCLSQPKAVRMRSRV